MYAQAERQVRKDDDVGRVLFEDIAAGAQRALAASKRPSYILDPASVQMSIWDAVTAMALIFTALAVRGCDPLAPMLPCALRQAARSNPRAKAERRAFETARGRRPLKWAS